MNHQVSRFICVLFAVSMIICLLPAQGAAAAKKKTGKVAISDESVTLTVGDTFTVSLKNAESTVKWKSKKASVATVGQKTGEITAVAPMIPHALP